VCGWLRTVRESPPSGRSIDQLERLLPESHAVYQERPRPESVLIRSALFLTLAAAGPRGTLIPWIEAELATAHDALTFAAAARTAACLSAVTERLIDTLPRPFHPDFMDAPCSLEDFTQSRPLESPTCARQEAVKALVVLSKSSRRAGELLRELSARRV